MTFPRSGRAPGTRAGGRREGGRPGRGLDLAPLRRLAALARPHAGWLALGVASVAFAGVIGLAFPLVVRSLLDAAFAPGAAPGAARRALDGAMLLLIALMLVQAGFNFLRTYSLGRVGEAVVADLRKAVFGHLIGLDVPFFTGRKTGELVSRLTADVATVQAAVSQALAQLVNQGITLLGGLVLLFVLQPRLTLVMLAVVPPVVVAGAVFGRGLRRASAEFQDRLAAASADAEEAIGGVRVVKAFGAEETERRRYAAGVDAAFRAGLRRVRLRALFIPAVLLCAFAGLGTVLWYGGRLALAGQLSSGDLVAFLLLTMFVAGSLGTFTGLWSQLQEASGASQRVFELLDARPELPVDPDPVRLPSARGSVALEDVSFTYPGRPSPALAGVSLAAEPGSVVAVVGPSGAGKSTLLSLLLRFADPTSGRVTLDGVDLRRLDPADLRRHVGYVPQETVLFSGSVAENLRLAKPDASDDELRAAAEAADAHAFIAELPQGYDTPVGERGVRLSGGQRQRIAIARALLKDPRVLLLDEATSSLDGESEAAVQRALARLMAGRTTVVVAHRLATVVNADRIYVLHAGRVVDAGTHAELLARGGLYRALFASQAEAGITGDPEARRALYD
jgi:subfamily B ATP-binding cassette protein MsbA